METKIIKIKKYWVFGIPISFGLVVVTVYFIHFISVYNRYNIPESEFIYGDVFCPFGRIHNIPFSKKETVTVTAFNWAFKFTMDELIPILIGTFILMLIGYFFRGYKIKLT